MFQGMMIVTELRSQTAAPADVDDLIKQIKSAAKDAGLPADQIESWLKTKAEDGKVDVEAVVGFCSRLQTVDPRGSRRC